MEKIYANSAVDWCCVRPTGLKEGRLTKKTKEIDSFPFNAWISKADVAYWMVEHLTSDFSANRTPIITEAK